MIRRYEITKTIRLLISGISSFKVSDDMFLSNETKTNV